MVLQNKIFLLKTKINKKTTASKSGVDIHSPGVDHFFYNIVRFTTFAALFNVTWILYLIQFCRENYTRISLT